MWHETSTPPYEMRNSQFSYYGGALVAVYLLGIYTEVWIYLKPNVPWPSTFAGIAGILLFFKNVNTIRQVHIITILMFIFICILSIFIAPRSLFLLGERALSLLQLTYSIGIGYGLYLEFVRWRRDQVARVFLFASIIIVFGCAFEVFTPFKAVSDAFREFVLPDHFVYRGDARDIATYGIVRPKFFTAEPSHVAKYFLFCITAWLALSTAKSRFLLFLVLVFLGEFLIRSPVLLLAAVTAVAVFFLPKNSSQQVTRNELPNRLLQIGLVITVGLIATGVGLATVQSSRLAYVLSGTDGSFFVRILGPMLIAWETISRYPFFGAGLGGKEAIIDIIWEVYAPMMDMEQWYHYIHWQMKNAVWLHWIYLGAMGGILGSLILLKFIEHFSGGGFVFVIIVMLTLGQIEGAYVSPTIWTFFFTILATMRICIQEEQDMRILESISKGSGIWAAELYIRRHREKSAVR